MFDPMTLSLGALIIEMQLVCPFGRLGRERPVTIDNQRLSALIDSIWTQKHRPCSTPFIPEALG